LVIDFIFVSLKNKNKNKNKKKTKEKGYLIKSRTELSRQELALWNTDVILSNDISSSVTIELN